MALSSLQLEAFYQVARDRSFSKAAQSLHITQSALSQRVLNLEEELEVALFVRDPSGVRLTEAGESLLLHCRTRMSLEAEFLDRLKGDPRQGLGGVIRIGGFSSVIWSVVAPAMTPLIRKNPAVQVEAMAREISELPGLLRAGTIDFMVLDHELSLSGIEAQLLGYEENVLIEAKDISTRKDVFLDHDPDDTMTERFLQLNSKLGAKRPSKFQRSFLEDVHGVMQGAALGWGRAVVSRHLVAGRKDLRIVEGYKALRTPVILHFFRQPYYSALHQEFRDTLIAGSGRILNIS